MSREQKNMKWPDGYCLDPEGKMVPPEGKDEDYNFGYENGFLDAWEIMNNAIRAAEKARADAAKKTPNDAIQWPRSGPVGMDG